MPDETQPEDDKVVVGHDKHKHRQAATTHSSNDQKVHNSTVRYKNWLRDQRALVLTVVLVIIGLGIAYYTFAASTTLATKEAESMALPSGGVIVSDINASAGKAVRLSQAGTSLSGSVSLSGTASSLNIRAHGGKCRGNWPTMTVLIDNTPVLSNKLVNSSTWQTSSVAVNLGAVTHSITIKDVSRYSCTYLYIDNLQFYGTTPTTSPAPTLTLSASPATVNSGSSSTLTWNSVNATSCTASGSWSGTQQTSGSAVMSSLGATSTYTLDCTGSGGTASASTTVTVTAPPPVTSGSIYWGAWIDGDPYEIGSSDAPWSAQIAGGSWDIFEGHTGKKVSVLHYGQPPMWAGPFYPGTANLITSRGAIPMMDMSSQSVPLTDITNKVYDSSIVTWANAVKAWGKPMFFRWNWEMNGPWFSWGSQAQQNPANFVAAWKHMHDVVAAQGATNVTWVWCPNTEYPGSTPLNSLYPGDSYVDWTCVDGYNNGTSPYKSDSWKTFSQVFQTTYNSLSTLAPTKPIMIGETASSEYGGSKAAWITDALKTQLPTNFPRVKALVWFNWNILEGGGRVDWPVESSATAQSAFQSGISSAYYKSNTFGTLPLLSKVPTP